MAKADAWGAPDGSTFARRGTAGQSVVAGNARIIAAPAYRRLLAAEPLLQAFDPDPDRHLPDRHRRGALPVADGAARRRRARRQGDPGARRRRTGQRADARRRQTAIDRERMRRDLLREHTASPARSADSHVLVDHRRRRSRSSRRRRAPSAGRARNLDAHRRRRPAAVHVRRPRRRHGGADRRRDWFAARRPDRRPQAAPRRR